MKNLKTAFAALLLLGAAACGRNAATDNDNAETAEPQNLLYGIDADNYRTETGEVANGETMGGILNRFGISALAVDRLDKASRDVFPLRNIRPGHMCTAFIHEDSL